MLILKDNPESYEAKSVWKYYEKVCLFVYQLQHPEERCFFWNEIGKGVPFDKTISRDFDTWEDFKNFFCLPIPEKGFDAIAIAPDLKTITLLQFKTRSGMIEACDLDTYNVQLKIALDNPNIKNTDIKIKGQLFYNDSIRKTVRRRACVRFTKLPYQNHSENDRAILSEVDNCLRNKCRLPTTMNYLMVFGWIRNFIETITDTLKIKKPFKCNFKKVHWFLCLNDIRVTPSEEIADDQQDWLNRKSDQYRHDVIKDPFKKKALTNLASVRPELQINLG